LIVTYWTQQYIQGTNATNSDQTWHIERDRLKETNPNPCMVGTNGVVGTFEDGRLHDTGKVVIVKKGNVPDDKLLPAEIGFLMTEGLEKREAEEFDSHHSLYAHIL
jgi:hypothetical protein